MYGGFDIALKGKNGGNIDRYLIIDRMKRMA